METILLFPILVIFKLTGVYCVECRETSLTSGSRSFSCLYGCCGEIYQRYCCPSDEEAFPIEVVKAGIGVGVVVVVVVIILIVVFMCKKKTPRTRALVVPQNANVRTSTIPLSDTEYTLKPQTGQAEYQPPLSYPGGGVHTGPVVPAYTRSYNSLPPPYNVSSAYNNTAIVPVN